MTENAAMTLQQSLNARYSDAPPVDAQFQDRALLATMAARGSCREYQDTAVPLNVIETLCALALASPSKSDLQQRDIVLLRATEKREALARLVGRQRWVAEAPNIAIFCGNNRRQRLFHDWHKVPFANDHLDAFFNAVGDAAIALGAFVTAAEAIGLGCCPISAVRNEAPAVSDLLGLPDHVFPFAGLAFGYPLQPPTVSKRLPLAATVHVDQYHEEGIREAVQTYDQDRADSQPYAAQRFPEEFGNSETYGWSEDKVRQYSQPERESFGAFVREKGFKLD